MQQLRDTQRASHTYSLRRNSWWQSRLGRRTFGTDFGHSIRRPRSTLPASTPVRAGLVPEWLHDWST